MRTPVLAVMAVVLLVVDVALLALVVRTASAHAVTVPSILAAPTRPVPVALILSTRDPRTPRPTRTSTATTLSTGGPATAQIGDNAAPAQSDIGAATPLSDAHPTPEFPPAALSPQSAVTQATPAPPEGSRSSMITAPTATSQPGAVGTVAVDPGTGQAGTGPGSADVYETTGTPGAEAGQTPPVGGAETPAGNAGETPPPPEAPGTFDDLPDFETYLRTYRKTVGGQPVDILSLTIDRTDAAVPLLVLEVVASETNDVFATRSAAAVLDYGRGLLDDAKSYLGGARCAVAVVSTYDTADTGACSGNPAWCQVGGGDQPSVTWTYVRGRYTGGPYALETWLASP